ncbi:MAG TPA: hypothetical protein VLB27_03225 [candidate division Zixibacteria bacterium]|nr:hypothetical protein [candidate division Zixibacteria bacterium]
MRNGKTISLVTCLLALVIGSFAAAASAPTATVEKRTDPITTSGDAATVNVQTTNSSPTVIKSATQQEMEKLITEAETNPQTQAAATYDIPWSSINGGGTPMSSASYAVNSSVGQAAIGAASSASYQVGAGYWYGTEAASGGGCACDCHADPQCDGVTNVLDVVHGVNIAFKGSPDINDPNANCPRTTTDVDCNGFTNVLDVVRFVNVAFKGGNPATEFCNPCP